MLKPIAAVAVAVGLVGAAVLPSPASAAGAGQRVDMKVLLLSKDGREPGSEAWEHALRKEGVPYDKIVADTDGPITPETLAEGATRARYQAVVAGGSVALAGFSEDERAALDGFERAFGIRRVIGYVYPGSQYGLTSPTRSGDPAGTVAQVTTAGRQAFGYLKGPVPIDNHSWGYLGAFPALGSSFQTLVAAPDGSVVVGVNAAGGREELVTTIDANQWQSHGQMLAHGLLAWVTRGAYLGYERRYLTMHVDDVFLPNDRWDAKLNTTVATRPIRMTDRDVTRAVNWSQANGFKLDMAFNGGGSVEAGTRDKLTATMLANKDKFRWINHTYDHIDLDDVDDDPANGEQPAGLATIRDQIKRNVDWARSKNIALDATELVTGEHSGLENPHMPQALTDTGIGWIAGDNSRRADQYQLGSALTVPRHPTGVYYNVGTRAEQLDEYNWIYHENCTNTATTTCLAQPATWERYIDSEARIVMRHVMDNDPRSHYAHQSNLAEDGTLYALLDEVLRRHRERFATPLEQPTHKEVGRLLQRRGQWDRALAAGTASGYLLDGKMYIQSAQALQAPVTGSAAGTAYDRNRNSAWVAVGPSPTVLSVTATG